MTLFLCVDLQLLSLSFVVLQLLCVFIITEKNQPHGLDCRRQLAVRGCGACQLVALSFFDYIFSEVAQFEVKKFTYIVEFQRTKRALEEESIKSKFAHLLSDHTCF